MFKISKRAGIAIAIVILVTIALVFLVPVVVTSGGEILNLLPFELPSKGNPKLDSQLNQLIQAERQGKAAVFAEQSNIELVGGKVRVVIECLPDQVEAASKEVSSLAIVEASYGNLLQVVVPISNLNALGNVASVRFVRLPGYPEPAINQPGKGTPQIIETKYSK